MDTEQATRLRMEREQYGTVTVELTVDGGAAMVQIDVTGRRPVRLSDERLGLLIEALTAVRSARNATADTIEAIGNVARVTV